MDGNGKECKGIGAKFQMHSGVCSGESTSAGATNNAPLIYEFSNVFLDEIEGYDLEECKKGLYEAEQFDIALDD